jgi:hypothetical protein
MLPSLARLALPLLVLLLGLPAGATSMLKVDVAELSRQADAIVHGTVRRVESRWSGDGRRILTDIEVEVVQALKGQPGPRVLITQPGGKVGNIGQVVSGQASFAPGEEVVLFLERRGPQAFRVSAMAQGKYRVQRSPDGKTVLAVPEPLGDALLVDASTGEPTQASTSPLPLSELESSIRTALIRPRGPSQQE